ncbi:MAG: hypothetical protein RDU89_10770 [bacterium]|nr:hypothetical protein [bacterium]
MTVGHLPQFAITMTPSSPKLTVDVDHLENEVLSIIRSKYTSPEAVDRVTDEIMARLSQGQGDYQTALRHHDGRLKKIEKEKRRLLDAIKSGIDPAFVQPEVDALTAQESDIK